VVGAIPKIAQIRLRGGAERKLKTLICLLMLVVMLPVMAEGEWMAPIYNWDRGLVVTPETLYKYFGFCSEPDCWKMRKVDISDAPFTVIPLDSVKKPFIVRTPFMEPYETDDDIWKGMAEFVKEILRKQ
jgi:hypothetical protein